MSNPIFSEPASMNRVKDGILIASCIGTALFIIEDLFAWLYPVVTTLFGRYALFHLFHLISVLGCIIIKWSLTKPPGLAVFIGYYIVCGIMDVIGAILRTFLLYYWSATLNPFDYFIAFVLVAVDYGLLMLSIIQVIMAILLVRITNLHIHLVDTTISMLGSYKDSPDKAMEFAEKLQTLERQYAVKNPFASIVNIRSKSKKKNKESDSEVVTVNIQPQ
jgi:hypothetical protein